MLFDTFGFFGDLTTNLAPKTLKLSGEALLYMTHVCNIPYLLKRETVLLPFSG